MYSNDGPGTLTAILSEPHYPLGHVLLKSMPAAMALGLRDPLAQRLGRGSFGAAYAIELDGNKSVLKFTRDPTEAQASAFLRGKRHKNVVDIYETWSLNWTHERSLRGWYVVHRGYLNPLSKRDAKIMDTLWLIYGDTSLDLSFPRKQHRAMTAKWQNCIRDAMEDAGFRTQPLMDRAMVVLRETSECVHALHSLGIDWEDIHSGNLMRRNDGTLVVADVGYGLMHDEVEVFVANLTPELARDYASKAAAA